MQQLSARLKAVMREPDLLAHGCHISQVYFFSPPVPAEDVHQVIERIEVRLTS